MSDGVLRAARSGYRRDRGKPGGQGLVELVASQEQCAFHSMEELWAILVAGASERDRAWKGTTTE